MSRFKDSVGREWSIAATTSSIKRVRRLADVDLLDVFDGKLYPKLLTDAVIMSEVAWAFVEPDAKGKALTHEQFDDALDGPAIAEMNAAVLEAMIDFFQKDKPETSAGLSKILEIRKAMSATLIKQVGEMTLETILSKMPKASAGSSAGLAESPVSIPVL